MLMDVMLRTCYVAENPSHTQEAQHACVSLGEGVCCVPYTIGTEVNSGFGQWKWTVEDAVIKGSL
jgi:hypothetical protein